MKLVVKFTPPDEGGRQHLPDLSGGLYRPHVVVDECAEGELLGVQFLGCSGAQAFGIEINVTVRLPYEGVDYSPLQEGTTFVIKEGANRVGFGRVVTL